MPAPSSALNTQRPDLASSFMEFDLAMEHYGYIAHRVLPVVEVAKQDGNFGVIPVEQLLQERNVNRAPGAGYDRGNWTFTPSTYTCLEYGAEEPVDDREAEMYADYFDAEQVAAWRAYSAVLRAAEARAEALIFNTTTWTGASLTTAVTNEWDDTANATPLVDVEAAVQNVYDNSGLKANALVIGWKVFRNLRNCDEIKDRLASSGAGESNVAGRVAEKQLAELFDLDHIIVGGEVENTAKEGQSASLSPLWSGEYAMVCKVATGSDFKEPCIGRIFHWSQDGSTIGGTVESYREEQTRSNVIRVRHDVDEVVLYAEAGHLLSNITT